MSGVLSTVIIKEEELCYQLISLFSETFPSQFRYLSQLKFLSTKDNRMDSDNKMDSENTNIDFVSLCTWLPHWVMCRVIEFH